MKEHYYPPNCPDRSAVPNCHTTCERHKKYLEKKEAMKEAKRKESLKHQAIERPYLAKANIKKKAR